MKLAARIFPIGFRRPVLGRRANCCLSLLLTALLLTGAGCRTAKMYNGPAKPKAEVADLFRHANDVEIVALDGHKIPCLKRARILELLPGRHAIECRFRSEFMDTGYVSASTNKSGTVRLEFDAKAGNTYWINSNVNPFAGEWRPQVMSGSGSAE
jgi:hypothetical protein